MDANAVMNVRSLNDLCLEPLDVVDLDPEIGTHALRAVDAFRIAEKQAVLAVVAVEPRERDIAVLCLCRDRARVIKGEWVGDAGLFLCNRDRPRTAVLQKLAVRDVRMADRPVRKEASGSVIGRRLNHEGCDRAVNIGLADDRDTLLIEDGVCCARHDAELVLQRVPALDRAGVAVVLSDQIFHRDRKAGDIRELLVRDIDCHVLPAVVHCLADTRVLRDGMLHSRCQLRKRDRCELDVELLEKLALVAHRGPEVVRSRAHLQNPDVPERLHNVAHRKEVPHAALEDRIGKAAVREIRERNAEPAQNLACRKEAALGVTESPSVLIRALVERAPQKHRDVQVLREPRALVLRAEIAVRKQQAVHLLASELLHDLQPVVLVVEKTLVVDVIDVNKIDAHLAELVRRQVPVFDRVRRAENAAAGRCVP